MVFVFFGQLWSCAIVRRNDLLAGVDNVHELWFQGGTADEETIDVGFLGQLLGIGSGHRAAVLDAQRFGYFL